jgi:hypothetical protein
MWLYLLNNKYFYFGCISLNEMKSNIVSSFWGDTRYVSNLGGDSHQHAYSSELY